MKKMDTMKHERGETKMKETAEHKYAGHIDMRRQWKKEESKAHEKAESKAKERREKRRGE